MPKEEKIELITESVQLGGPGPITETGPYITVPVHITHEGVANRGLKMWDQIYDPDEIDGVHSFEGAPIFRGHPVFGKTEVGESLGRLQKVTADTVKKRADCEAKLVRNRLTGKELERLRKGESVAGSIGYNSKTVHHDMPKKWDDGSEYDWEVKKPFFADHYALLGEADTPACKVCGFNPKPGESLDAHLQSHHIGETEEIEETRLVLQDGRVRKCPKSKLKEGAIDMEAEELKKILGETVSTAVTTAVKESVEPLAKRIEALEKKEGPKLAEIPEFKALSESVGKIAEALPDIAAQKAQQEAAKLATRRGALAKNLKAAYTKEGKPEGEAFEKVWTEASKHPLGELAFLEEHPEMKLALIQERQFGGRIMGGASGEFDIQAERMAHREKTGQVI